MSLRRSVLALSLLICLTSVAYADLAPQRSPLPKPPLVAPVRIVEGKVDNLDPNVAAKIVIPKSLLPELQESLSGTQGSTESPFALMTIVAGLALTAAAISLMFANKTSPHWKKGVIGLIGCSLLVGIVLLANFLFPPKLAAPTADQSQPERLIVIEIQERGHEVILVLPRSK
jgi:hypothetical protein